MSDGGENRASKEPQTKKGRSTKARIFDAAVALIKERGYEATSIPDICLKAEISTGAFYHHFRSKQDILVGYIVAESDDLLEYYATLASLSRREALLLCLDRFYGYFEKKGPELVSHFIAHRLMPDDDAYGIMGFSLFKIAAECLELGGAEGRAPLPLAPGDGPGHRLRLRLERHDELVLRQGLHRHQGPGHGRDARPPRWRARRSRSRIEGQVLDAGFRALHRHREAVDTAGIVGIGEALDEHLLEAVVVILHIVVPMTGQEVPHLIVVEEFEELGPLPRVGDAGSRRGSRAP